MSDVHPLSFPRRMRLTKRGEFQAVFAAAMRKSVGPLLVYAFPNGLGHPRLGLTVSRRVGRAVVRNRIKRLLREAFRLAQHDLPGGYDLVIVVRRHAPLSLDAYGDAILRAADALDLRWKTSTNSTTANDPVKGVDSESLLD